MPAPLPSSETLPKRLTRKEFDVLVKRVEELEKIVSDLTQSSRSKQATPESPSITRESRPPTDVEKMSFFLDVDAKWDKHE